MKTNECRCKTGQCDCCAKVGKANCCHHGTARVEREELNNEENED